MLNVGNFTRSMYVQYSLIWFLILRFIFIYCLQWFPWFTTSVYNVFLFPFWAARGQNLGLLEGNINHWRGTPQDVKSQNEVHSFALKYLECLRTCWYVTCWARFSLYLSWHFINRLVKLLNNLGENEVVCRWERNMLTVLFY